MENNGFEQFAKAWKKSGQAGSTSKKYVEKDINAFKMKKSKDFSVALNRAIQFDIIHKSILSVGMLLLIWFYRADQLLVLVILALMGLSVFLLWRELGIKKELRTVDNYSRSVSAVIREKVKFFSSYFPSLQWMMAFTNGLLVWVGSLFYFYSKYGYYRVEDIYDILVNLVMVSLAIGISFYAYQYQYRLQLLELEENLSTIDEASASQHIQIQKKRKRRFIIGLVILTTIGLLLFLFLIIAYMRQLA